MKYLMIPVAFSGCQFVVTFGESADTGADIVDTALLAPDCTAYDHFGTVYDCTTLDRCTESNFDFRLACCACDPEWCNPDPTCPHDTGRAR